MEPVSAAGSFISVVSLAIQLADKIQQLHDFWQSFKQAPAEIEQITDDLDTFREIIKVGARTGAGNDPLLHKTLQRCNNRIDKLRALVEKLEPGVVSQIRAVRQWSAFRMVLKKNIIQRFQAAITETKLDLVLVRQNLAE